MTRQANAGTTLRAAGTLGLVAAYLILSAPMSAQEPKLRLTLLGHTGAVRSLAFSPDSKTLASGSDDDSIKLWNVATGRNNTTLKEQDPYLWDFATFSPDGKMLATGGCFNKVKLWDLGTLKGKILLDERRQCPETPVVFSPDGKTLASGGMCRRGIKLFDVATGKNTVTLDGYDLYGVSAIIFTQDSKTLVSVGYHDGIKLWDVATGTNTATRKTAKNVPFAVFSPDGKILAAASYDKIVDEGGRNVVKETGRITLWEVATGKRLVIGKPAAKTDPAVIAEFVRQLGNEDFETRERASSALAKLHEVPAILRDAVKSADPEITRRAKVAVGVIKARIKEQGTLKGHTACVSCVVFSPDGKTLASGSEDTTIKLWDMATGKQLANLKGHTDKLSSLAFSPDGRTLASASDDKTIKLWDMAKAK